MLFALRDVVCGGRAISTFGRAETTGFIPFAPTVHAVLCKGDTVYDQGLYQISPVLVLLGFFTTMCLSLGHRTPYYTLEQTRSSHGWPIVSFVRELPRQAYQPRGNRRGSGNDRNAIWNYQFCQRYPKLLGFLRYAGTYLKMAHPPEAGMMKLQIRRSR
jgi:hypothetical protein